MARFETIFNIFWCLVRCNDFLCLLNFVKARRLIHQMMSGISIFVFILDNVRMGCSKKVESN